MRLTRRILARARACENTHANAHQRGNREREASPEVKDSILMGGSFDADRARLQRQQVFAFRHCVLIDTIYVLYIQRDS